MRLLIYFVLLLLSICTFSQSSFYNFSKLNTNNGLSNNQVNSILKDKDGFLWFGTTSGLNRYDGYSFKIYRKKANDNASLIDNNIISLFELPYGEMWIKTMGIPCIYNSFTEKFDTNYNSYLNSLNLPSGTIGTIKRGYNDRYWFLYNNQNLYLYSANSKTAQQFKYNRNTTKNSAISSLKETADGKLWLVYQNGLLQQYDIKSGGLIFSSTVLQQLFKENLSYDLIIDKDGGVWLWSYVYGAFLFNQQDNSIRRFNESSSPSKLNSNHVFEIIQDDFGLIWVATDHGGVTLIDKKNHFSTRYLLNDPNDSKSLSHNTVNTIYKDNQGIIWLGTYKQGVNFVNENITQFPYYHHKESDSKSLQYDDVNCFREDKLGNIWIGTNGGGLIYFDRKNNTFKQYLHDAKNLSSISSNVIVSLCMDDNGMLWIGTFLGGLCSFDGNHFRRYLHNEADTSSIASDNIWELFIDRDKNLWVGTLGGGLDLFDRKANNFKHNQFEIGISGFEPSKDISSIIQDRNGNLWVATDYGVTVINIKTHTSTLYQHTSVQNSLSHNNCTSLLEDSKGRIWVGTREGLNIFNEQTKSFQTFTIADGLPSNMILNIVEDKFQNLWISTANGLRNIIPEQKKTEITLSVKCYDEMNNLPGSEFNYKSAYKTRDGALIFGGPSGFNIINPAVIRKPIYHPEIVFTGLQIFNKNIEPGDSINNRVLLKESLSKLDEIELKFKENVFSIEFASLDFAHSALDKYSYMLEGFKSDWLNTNGSQRRVTYTNLDPGHYTFKVKVQDRNGLWSEIKTLKIYIVPPFWRTPLAYFIYLMFLVALLFLSRRITLDRIHMRYEVANQRKSAERAYALDQLKTKFFTNVSHEFRTPLSLIISPLDKLIKYSKDEEQEKQLKLVQRNAKRLLSLVNQLLDFRKIEVQEIKLHTSIGDIIGFSKDISDSFLDIAEKKGIQLSFSTNIENLEVYFDKDKIEKILFNLLSNAYKYTPDNGRVSINLLYNPPVVNGDDGTLAIEVKDTGIGIPMGMHEKIFERFFQTDVPESMVNQGTGIGLAITKEFVKLHNGIISVKSEPEQGSCFTVLLPAKKINDTEVKAALPQVIVEDAELVVSEEGQKKHKKKLIIIVEDNEDIRFYLKDNLKGQYKVEEATNGKEGWEKIKQLNPDLVVSDVMMPLIDGIELARKIKNETLTAHIPVILLTAIGSEEKQLEGLKVGVNDYITKPFTFEILASRIRNLLAQQELLQHRFHKQIEVNPSEITITSIDEKFLKQALEAVEKNIDNPDFSVEDFSSAMFMNRVTLYRKILSITGKSPMEFIRSMRLKRAAQLLEKSGMSISEIAYEVGFNNPKIFTKFFKEEFNVLPSQYVANKKNEDT